MSRPMHLRYEHGGPQRRFASIIPQGRGVVLSDNHDAVKRAGTLFPSRVFHAADVPRLLISGVNGRKIGKTVAKGKWRGLPIYMLTLEERATCPLTCAAWRECYGNNMHMARRIVADDAFEVRLWDELAMLDQAHPAGFVVRLHILGDFYSEEYVQLWGAALDAYSGLRIFGFTARDPIHDPIGVAVAEIAGRDWNRFAVRFSGAAGPLRASRMIERGGSDPEAITCPAQLGKTDCCATCALCWQSQRSVAFARH